MDAVVFPDIVSAELGQVKFQIGAGHGTIVAAEAVIFGHGEMEKPLMPSGRVRPMTASTGVVCNSAVCACQQVLVVSPGNRSG
jgi:thioredoxin reductase